VAEAAEQKAEKLEAEKLEAEKSAESARLEAEKLRKENFRLKEAAERTVPTTVKKPKKGFGWWCEKVCLIASGVAVGVLFGSGMSNPKN
jgi:hypothetical protein